jgi:hypothetical protein
MAEKDCVSPSWARWAWLWSLIGRAPLSVRYGLRARVFLPIVQMDRWLTSSGVPGAEPLRRD